MNQHKPLRRASFRWAELSQEELLAAQLTVDDPEALENVVKGEPADGDISIEYAYNLKGKRSDYVECAFCKHPNHYKGFVIIHEDGTRRLVGHQCAENHYGVRFDAIQRDYETARDLRYYLERRNKIIAGEDQLRRGISGVVDSTAMNAYGKFRQQLREVLQSRLTRELGELATRGNQLAIEVQVRDFEAEERRESIEDAHAEELAGMSKRERRQWRVERGLKSGDLYKIINQPIGSVPAKDLFEPKEQPKSIIDGHIIAIQVLLHDIKTVKNWSPTKLQGRITELKDTLLQFRYTVRALYAPIELFERDALDRFIRWANDKGHRDGLKFSAAGRSITCRSDDGYATASLPADYEAPSLEFIEIFLKDAIS